jgi:hypothetical protein
MAHRSWAGGSVKHSQSPITAEIGAVISNNHDGCVRFPTYLGCLPQSNWREADAIVARTPPPRQQVFDLRSAPAHLEF